MLNQFITIGKLYKMPVGKQISAIITETKNPYFFLENDIILILDLKKRYEPSTTVKMLCDGKILEWPEISNYVLSQLIEIVCE